MPRIDSTGSELEEKVVRVNRVAKVVKGGRRFSFSALVVVGDGQGHVGPGLGRQTKYPTRSARAPRPPRGPWSSADAAGTIPHLIVQDFGAARVLLKPAAPGTGASPVARFARLWKRRVFATS